MWRRERGARILGARSVRCFEQFGRGATPAANIVVVHCEIGAAPAIARALDEQREMRIEELGDTWLPTTLPELPPLRWAHVAPLARHEFPAETIAALHGVAASRSTDRASCGCRG